MTLRIKLALLFLALAIIPLVGLVLYSYETSRRALRNSSETQALAMAEDLDRRMTNVRDGFEERFARLAGQPWVVEMPGEDTEVPRPESRQALVQQMIQGLGESAQFLEALEFVPMAPAAPQAPTAPEANAPPAPPAVDAPPLPPTPDGEVEAEIGARIGALVMEKALQLSNDETLRAELGDSLGELSIDLLDIGLDALGEDSDQEEIQRRLDHSAARFSHRWRAVIEHRGEQEVARLIAPDPEVERSDESRAETELLVIEDDGVAIPAPDARTPRTVHWTWEGSTDEPTTGGERPGLGPEFGVPVLEDGTPIGQVLAQVDAEGMLRRVLDQSHREQGEIPFAFDLEGNLFVADEDDRAVLETVLPGTESEEGRLRALDDGWVVVRRRHDDQCGVEFGIARPIGESLEEVRMAARKTFGMGLALIVVALFGVLPLAHRVTRNLREVTESAGRIAEGDLATRVPVRSRDEVGHLARAFNDMAAQLAVHEERLLEDQRERHEGELERQRLAAEVDRKSRELEEARDFQLSLLPKSLPTRDDAQVAVHMDTATEVGGDYYDLFEDGGALVLAVGDATGHGARAGTMVTVTKSLVASYHPGQGPGAFLSQASATIRRMDLGRMAMALMLAEWDGRRLRLAAAGMPPALVHRAGDGRVEEIALPALPLGSRLATHYEEHTLALAAGDTLLLMSDGFPELLDGAGEPLGYERVRTLFGDAAAQADDAKAVVATLQRAVEEHQHGPRPSDDVTFVVLRAA